MTTQIEIPLQESFQFTQPDAGIKNPCVWLHGPGPADARCKACVHFVRVQKGKTYLKCDLRRITNSEASDHRANWPACAKFQKDKLL